MIVSGAIFSPNRMYRYQLWRTWLGGEGHVVFIGLNPSTADETQDDPTIRRCIAFAKIWGHQALCMVNLFAYRATQPADMLRAADPVGPENDWALANAIKDAAVVVAAWGTNGYHFRRDARVRTMFPKMQCLKLTKDGHPSHPLYLPKTLCPIPFAAVNVTTATDPPAPPPEPTPLPPNLPQATFRGTDPRAGRR